MGLHAEAFDYESARGYCLEALQTMRKDRDLYTAFLGQILLGRAYLGLLDYPRAWECFHAVSSMIDQEHLIRLELLPAAAGEPGRILAG